MNTVNVGEYGIKIYFDLGEDISAATNTVILRSPSGGELAKAATVGTANYLSDIGTMTANQYVTYTLASGDINVAGDWRVRVRSVTGASDKKTPWQRLKVEP